MDARRRASRPICPHSGKLAHPSVSGSVEPVGCPHCHRTMELVDDGRRFPRHRMPSPRRIASTFVAVAIAAGLLAAGCTPPPPQSTGCEHGSNWPAPPGCPTP